MICGGVSFPVAFANWIIFSEFAWNLGNVTVAGHPPFHIFETETFLPLFASEGFVHVPTLPTTEVAMFKEAGVLAFELIFEKFGKHVGVVVHTMENAFFVGF